MKFHTRRPTALAALLLTATFALAGCGSDDGDSDSAGDSGSGSGGGDLSMTMLPKNLGNAYFDTSTKGAETAADELGADIEEVGPETGSPDAQVSYINTVAQQGKDALILSANDPELAALVWLLLEARVPLLVGGGRRPATRPLEPERLDRTQLLDALLGLLPSAARRIAVDATGAGLDRLTSSDAATAWLTGLVLRRLRRRY